MALAPKNSTIVEVGGTVDSPSNAQPSKTYYIDFEKGLLSSKMVDGEDALRQFIKKTVQTSRFRFMIYTDEYGCELEELIGQDVSMDLLQVEIPRVIKEALVYDDRIEDVIDFEIVKTNKDLYISFKVVTVDGMELIEEVSV